MVSPHTEVIDTCAIDPQTTHNDGISSVLGDVIDVVSDESTLSDPMETTFVKLILDALMNPLESSWERAMHRIVCRMILSYITHHIFALVITSSPNVINLIHCAR